ncbi:MAG: DEAD/DEAH box helicase family protein [Sulfobacillus sp.]
MALTLFGRNEGDALRPLRPYQAKAIESIRQAVREGHKRIVLQIPTGGGKTLIAAHLITSSIDKDKRSLFTCPRKTLVNQTLKHFEREGIRDIGVIQAKHERTDWRAQVQIASVQTLIRRALPEVDFIIVDEVHMNWNALNERLDCEEWKAKIVIGLSATPWAKGMGRRWTKLIVASSIRELIDEGYLAPFIVYAPAIDPDLTGVKILAGDYEENSLAAAMDKPQLVADVVTTWQEKGTPDRTFLFAVNCAHAKSLRDEFEKIGVSCGYIDACTEDDQRERVFARFRNGEDKIVASVGCLTTGVDEDVHCIVDAAPTKSEMLYVQRIGRGLRPADGKAQCIVLDHAGNTQRLGLVTDIHHDHLDKRKPSEKGEAYSGEKAPPKPRKCQKCHALIPPGKPACPQCGEKIAAVSDVLVADGELVLYGSDAKPKKEEKLAYTMEEKQEWFSGFLYLAQERNRQQGWASWRYKEKFGVWPNQLAKIPAPPSFDVIQFDKHCRIRYAKARKAAS